MPFQLSNPYQGKKFPVILIIIILIAIPIFIIILALLSGSGTKSNQVQTTSQTAQITQTVINNPTPTSAQPINPEVLEIMQPTPTDTPSPTPLPGLFYIPNHQQNDLVIKIWNPHGWDLVDEVRLVNTSTTETRIIGKTLDLSPGDSAFFSPDFSMVIFLGSKVNDTDYEKISFYSILKNQIVKQITLNNISAQLPSLKTDPKAILSRLILSPDGQKIALSYGTTMGHSGTEYGIDPSSAIIVYDLNTNKIKLLNVKGLVFAWQDNTTLQYQINVNNDPNNISVQEISIN